MVSMLRASLTGRNISEGYVNVDAYCSYTQAGKWREYEEIAGGGFNHVSEGQI